MTWLQIQESNLKKQWFYAMQRPNVHPQKWFLSCDLAGGHRLAEVRLKRIRIQVLCCGSPIRDSYLQTPAHWSWQGPRVLQGITPMDYFRLLCWNPVLVFVSMGPVWGWRGGLTVLWIITWESRLWWPVLVSMSTGCRGWRGHTLWNASQSKGSYLLSSRSHHKPWRSCRAFENVSLCPGSFPATGPGLRNKEGKPSCNAKSLWRSNLPDGNAEWSKGRLEGRQEIKECLVTSSFCL